MNRVFRFYEFFPYHDTKIEFYTLSIGRLPFFQINFQRKRLHPKIFLYICLS